MQSHPHPDRPARRPFLGRQCLLRRQDRGDGRGRSPEGGAECVTDCLEDVTAGLLDRAAQDLIVPPERDRHRVGLGLPQPG
jgi:hypothetical protein